MMRPIRPHSQHCDSDFFTDRPTTDSEAYLLEMFAYKEAHFTPEMDARWNAIFDPRKAYEPASGQLPPDSTTIYEMKEMVYSRSKKLFDDWATLNKILQRHEGILRKRWPKKTMEQRKKVLLAAWPSMPLSHRPGLRTFESIPDDLMDSQLPKYRNDFLWPYINLEDLARGNLLLIFINARGRHSPDEFAHADWDAATLGHKSGAVQFRWFNCHTMLFLCRHTPEPYGVLTDWIHNSKAREWLENRIGFWVGQGLIILDIQQKILEFLVKCCYVIFQDRPSESLVDESVSIQPEPTFSPVADGSLPSLETIAAEAPYRVPAHLDVTRLHHMVLAKRSAAEDHIWTLREDPAYFSDTVKTYGDHRTERLLDIDGKPTRTVGKPLFWDRVLEYSIAHSYSNFELWNRVYRQLVFLANSKEKYSSSISTTERLPADLEDTFQEVMYLLSQASKLIISTLYIRVPSSLPFRPYYYRFNPVPGENLVIVELRNTSKFFEDKLIWLYQNIVQPDRVRALGLSFFVDELERLIQRDFKQKERITPFVVRILSDLAVVAEIERQLKLFQPWAAGMAAQMEQNWKSYVKFEGICNTIEDFIADLEGISPPLSRLGTPSDGRFTYPAHQRRTRATTEVMRKAEGNLDLFWSTIDAHFADKSPRLKEIESHMSERRPFQRTPEWVEPIVEKKKKKKTRQAGPEQLYIPLPGPNPTEKDGACFAPPAGAGPPKIKTRKNALITDPAALGAEPVPTPEPVQHVQQHPEPAHALLPPSFTVSKRAFKIFSTLFHNPLEPNQPGEVVWSDFLHAFAAIGFAVEKLWGSEWQFTPPATAHLTGGSSTTTNHNADRSIVFHEPHPHKKIGFLQARRHGRRLNRVYGWTRESFVLG